MKRDRDWRIMRHVSTFTKLSDDIYIRKYLLFTNSAKLRISDIEYIWTQRSWFSLSKAAIQWNIPVF